jgi:hypothetical protein
VRSFVRFLAAESEVLIAGGRPAAAADLLIEACRLAEVLYGSRSPLLPLLLARALHAAGASRAAVREVDRAEALPEDIHARGAHQDRVTLLRAQAALSPDGPARERALHAADRTAEALLRGPSPGDPGAAGPSGPSEPSHWVICPRDLGRADPHDEPTRPL